ncbi:LOW QUALITY PROTEIN: rubisco accumulation factor 1.1, chloroplastic-like [Prosopis cineraria]|uniref:LOW QUALITY PROTEIN: rubisco accumulation factor 1.1, chloroplastic-like n=1 Tax=Prosopis cineraria TaxID=364024 RepID=UPI00240F7491|nr:LOW QUALITY PROTEIN: rubisco accumulation factor 1.1, chloroplastic-like [Prosopis cineraria]
MRMATMLSFSVNTLSFKPLSPIPPSFGSDRRSILKPVSAIIRPSNPQPQHQQPSQLYQPFRPPPSPLPSQFVSLDTTARLEILSNRLGLWHEYAPLIPSLIREGFTPPSIEEATGISGVEQNRLAVAAQVRDSLVQSNADPEILSAFDLSGSELLYEIRLLSASQRLAAARYIVVNKLDGQGAQDLARAMKDFPRRRGDKGWKSFDYTLPGDCLSFMYYRQSREHRNPSEQRTAALEQALSVAETEKAKTEILEELKGEAGEEEAEEEVEQGVRVPVVRLKMGEVAEASSVAVLPVCRAEEREKELMEAPVECTSEGEFGVVVAEKGWKRWVVLPGWEPVLALGKGGLVVSFADARVLPWKVNRWYKEEPILVVVDRTRNRVGADSGFYLVAVDDGAEGFKVERGSTLKNSGVDDTLGTVVLVVRPPKEEIDDQLSDEDWE